MIAPNISFDDFLKLDIRTGTIIAAETFPEARKPAYKLSIDFGDLGIMNSSAQIKNLYQPEDLIDRQIIAVVNFPAKQIGPYMSECLVLGVYDASNSVVLLSTDQKVENGSKIC